MRVGWKCLLCRRSAGARAAKRSISRRLSEDDLEGGTTPATGVREDGPVVSHTAAGVPHWVKAAVKMSVTSGPAMVGRA